MEQKENLLSTPVAIIIAGALIALAVVGTGKGSSPASQKAAVVDNGGLGQEQKAQEIILKPISSSDHVRGDIKAPVKIVEFSDTECPFCKNFHFTMKQVYEKYSKDGKFAWVYRQSPLDSLHSKARKEAEATECAAALGGNDVFWSYLDRLMEVTPSNNGLDPAELPKIAKEVGLDVAQFEKCLESGKYSQVVEDQLQDAIASGGGGTPHSIAISADDQKAPIDGAYPFDQVDKIVSGLLVNNK
ncbi:MAG: thioredoxin domain-containing protein [Candidatus Paceibacterota bacterium]|jgi:protein-disulfide isomerase